MVELIEGKAVMARHDIPRYTKIGIRITAFLMLLLIIMMTKNCVDSFQYGRTDNKTIEYYYRIGYAEGVRNAQGKKDLGEPDLHNPLLTKSYHKGFRDGWDAAQHVDTPLPKTNADII